VARQIVVDLVSDAADFEREMRRAAAAAENLEEAIEDAAESGDALGRASGKMAEAMDGASTQLTGVNDLVMGFSDVTGIALPPQAEMIMGFADMAGGLAVLLPNLAKAKTVMQAVNAVMRANPILTVVTVLALLTAAFVVAYKKSETFRNIVHGVFDGIKKAARVFVNAVKGYIGGIAGAYKAVFNGIANAWNNTVGRLSFSVPGWVPKIGGKGWDVPDIPTFAQGGRFDGGPMIVGEKGPEMLVPGMAGTIVPNNRMTGGGPVEVRLVIEGGQSEMRDLIRKIVRVNGGTAERAFA
jgi:hypothetical protein